MIGFRIGGPPEQLKELISAAREMIGFVNYLPGPWTDTAVIYFVDQESAQRAQWMIEANGAKKGVNRFERADEIYPE